MKFEILNLKKKYKQTVALDDFSVTMTSGIYGILGPNGAGKSTLMNILTDNLKRDEGAILYNGTDILEMGSSYRELVGYMPQEQVGYSQFSAVEFLRYMAVLKGLNVKKTDTNEQINQLLHTVNLYEMRHRKSGCFSGGMKRRLLLAQALLGNPKILILDEPTAGLDPKERISLRNMIAELATDRIVLLATHIVSDIECIADYVILMKKGSVLCCKSPIELIDSIQGKVAEIPCDAKRLQELQKKYPVSNVYQTREGYVLHVVGDELLEEASVNAANINLEDVYLYYFERGIYEKNNKI